MNQHFPTFERAWNAFGNFSPAGWPLPQWLSTPWWIADTLTAKQRSLLRIVTVGINEKLELTPLIWSLATEHRGKYRRRLFQLARRLESGTPLPVALEQTPNVLSDEQLLAVRFAVQSGTLSQTLTETLSSSDTAAQQIANRLKQIIFYGGVVATLFTLVLTFMMVKIVPSFQAILDDFSLEITEPMEMLIVIANVITIWGPLFLLILLLFLWLAKSQAMRRFFRRRILSRMLKPVAQLRAANLLSLLAVTQENGRPLPGAISTLARYHYDSLIRRKLLFVRNEIEQGSELWSSMAKVRLLSTAEARALESAADAGALPWTMRKLAQWKQDRVTRRLDALGRSAASSGHITNGSYRVTHVGGHVVLTCKDDLRDGLRCLIQFHYEPVFVTCIAQPLIVEERR